MKVVSNLGDQINPVSELKFCTHQNVWRLDSGTSAKKIKEKINNNRMNKLKINL